MKGEEFYYINTSIADDAASLLSNITEKVYKQETDNLFEQLQKENHSSDASYSYKKENYDRYGFKNVGDAYDFQQKMANKGIDVTVSPTKFYNQYIVEIPKEAVIDEVVTTIKTYDSADVISDYEKQHSTKVEHADMNDDLINNEFERLHQTEHSSDPLYNYSPDDYSRLEFNNSDEADDFKEDLSQKGIKSETYEYKDKTYIEFEKTSEVKTEETKSTTYNSGDVLRKYKDESDYDVKVENVHTNDWERNDNPYSGELSQVLLYSALGNLDTLGEVVSKAKDISYWANKGTDKEKAEDRLFKTGHFNSGAYQKDILLDENTVVRNGKIVTDEKEIEYVRKQHEARMARAEDDISRFTANSNAEHFAEAVERMDDIGRQNDVFQRHVSSKIPGDRLSQAERIKNAQLRQEYFSTKIDTTFLNSGMKILRDDLNTTAIALGLSSKISLDNDQISKFEDLIKNGKITDANQSHELSLLLFNLKHNSSYELKNKDVVLLNDILQKVSKDFRKKEVLSTSDERQFIKEAQNFINQHMSTSQMNMFSQTAKEMLAAKKELGVNLFEEEITTGKILDLNAAFLKKANRAGYNFIKITPLGLKFDIEKLKNLTPDQLKEIGISEEVRNLLIKINEKGSLGSPKFNLFRITRNLGTLVGKNEEVNEAISGISKSIKNGRRAIQNVSTAKKAGKAAKKLVNAARARLTGISGRHHLLTHKKKRKLKKKTIKRIKKAVNPTITLGSHVYNGKIRILHSVSNFIENNPLSQLANYVNKKAKEAMAKVMKAILKIFLKVFLVIVSVVVILQLFLLLILGVTTLVNSFLNVFGDIDSKNTIAYKLYEYLSEEEDQWVKGSLDIDNIKENDTSLKYGSSYVSFDDYIGKNGVSNTCKSLLKKDDKLYNNPWWEYSGEDGSDIEETHLVQIKKYDGTTINNFSTNNSIYNLTTREDGKENNVDLESTEVSAESGHTSNIKDIISMVDVLYNSDVDGSSDEDLTNILGKSPAALTWENLCAKVSGYLKWIQNALSHFFLGTEYVPRSEWTSDDKCSYKTIRYYAASLFEASHQNMIDLSVDYYELKDGIQLTVNGVQVSYGDTPGTAGYLEKLAIPQSELSKYGIALIPTIQEFEIDYFNDSFVEETGTGAADELGGRIETVVRNSSDEIIARSDVQGDVLIPYEHCLEPQHASLWYGMQYQRDVDGKDHLRETYLRLINPELAAKKWNEYKDTKPTVTDNLEAYQMESELVPYEELTSVIKTKTSTEKNSESAAKDDAKKKIVKYIKEEIAASQEKDPETGGIENMCSIKNPYYGMHYNSSIEDDIDNQLNEFVYQHLMLNENWENNIKYDVNEIRHTHTVEITDYDEDGNTVGSHEEEIYDYSTYFATAKVILTYHTDVFQRANKVNWFAFDGGHVSVETTGIIYSITNEQIDFINSFEAPDMLPRASDYTNDDYGTTLKGKNVLNTNGEVSISLPKDMTLLQWKTLFQSNDPDVDVQGSAAAKDGLNILMDGDTMKSGIELNPDFCDGDQFTESQKCKDIFDIDLVLLKGNNVFPWGSDFSGYMGWDEANMSMVINKVITSFNDSYQFDIPLELGGQEYNDGEITYTGGLTIGETDVEQILENIDVPETSSSGTLEPDRDEETLITNGNRRDLVQLALRWIGRGHYSSHFDSFLEKRPVQAIGGNVYSENNTGSTGFGFMKFLLNRNGKLNDTKKDIDSSYWKHYSGISDLKPGDIIRHEGNLNVDFTDGESISEMLATLADYQETKYAMYLGTLQSDVTLQDGTVLSEGTVLTVDLEKKGKYELGSIRLNTINPEKFNDYKTTANSTFYWVFYPSESTTYCSYGDLPYVSNGTTIEDKEDEDIEPQPEITPTEVTPVEKSEIIAVAIIFAAFILLYFLFKYITYINY